MAIPSFFLIFSSHPRIFPSRKKNKKPHKSTDECKEEGGGGIRLHLTILFSTGAPHIEDLKEGRDYPQCFECACLETVHVVNDKVALNFVISTLSYDPPNKLRDVRRSET